MARILTVGHGARSLDELCALMRAGGVGTLVDVRRFPRSRRHPHFNREELERALPAHDIAYVFAGDALGGRRAPTPRNRHRAWREEGFRGYAEHMEHDAFRRALDDVLELDRPCVMCAETLWWQCHRRLIADALTVRGHEVVHLLQPAQTQPHRTPPELRIDDGHLIYDRGAPELPV